MQFVQKITVFCSVLIVTLLIVHLSNYNHLVKLHDGPAKSLSERADAQRSMEALIMQYLNNNEDALTRMSQTLAKIKEMIANQTDRGDIVKHMKSMTNRLSLLSKSIYKIHKEKSELDAW